MAAEFLGATYADSTALVLGVRAVLDEIVWDEERTDQAEAAWEKLGLQLGFGSIRPERLYNTGPEQPVDAHPDQSPRRNPPPGSSCAADNPITSWRRSR